MIVLKGIRIIYLNLWWVLLTSAVFAQNEPGGLYLTGRITTEQGAAGGAVIQMTRNGLPMRDYQVEESGRYNLRFEFNYEYVLVFVRPGNFSQRYVISTVVPPDVLQRNRIFPPYPLDVALFTEIPNIQRTFSQNTVMRIYYSAAVDNFIPEVYYNNAQIKRLIDQAIAQSRGVDREADLLRRLSNAELTLLRRDYNQSLQRAASLFDQTDFIAALEEYRIASRIFPTEPFPRDRMAEIRDLIAVLGLEQELERAQNERYDRFVALADQRFDTGDYATARDNYGNALQVKPEAAYPVQRLNEIDRLIAAIGERELAEAARLAAEEAARLAAEQEAARLAAEEEAARLAAEQEAARLAAEQEAARLAAEEEAARLAAEQEAARLAAEEEAARLAAEESARLAAEQEAARLAAEQEAARLAAEETARLAAEQEAARLAAEQEAARLAAEQEAARLAAEQESARLAAEEEAARLAAEQEAARLAAEESARLAAEQEAARLAAEQEAARLTAEREAARLAAEETARLAAEQEAARLAAEQEAARLAAEQEAARLAAEQESARLAAEQEAARLAAEQESARLAAEETARLAAEQEAARLAAEQEAARLAAEQEAARLAAEQEAARLAAEQEAARLAAEEEAARLAAEEAARLAAEETARLAAEQEAARLAAEQEAARLAAEEEAARLAAEEEAARLAAEQEAARLAAEEAARLAAEEAARLAAEQEAARLAAEQEAARLAAEETARLAAEQEAARLAAEQEAARLAAEEEAARLAAEEAARLAAEEAARLALLEENYQKSITMGDSLFGQRRYLESLTGYRQALLLKPGEEYPVRQINEAERLHAASLDPAVVLYESLIVVADEAFTQSEFNVARAYYYRALAVKPGESYPQQRIDEIGRRVASMQFSQRDTEFQQFIDLADEAFRADELAVARGWYNRALTLRENDNYARSQIVEIQQLINARLQGGTDRVYNSYMEEGDRAFEEGDYSTARVWYQRALRMKPSEKLPVERLETIRRIFFDE